mgnify:CR=1 FL=1
MAFDPYLLLWKFKSFKLSMTSPFDLLINITWIICILLLKCSFVWRCNLCNLSFLSLHFTMPALCAGILNCNLSNCHFLMWRHIYKLWCKREVILVKKDVFCISFRSKKMSSAFIEQFVRLPVCLGLIEHSCLLDMFGTSFFFGFLLDCLLVMSRMVILYKP